MDQGLPEVAADQPEPRASGHRLGLGLLLIGIAVATIAVPALVAPRHKSPATPTAAPIPPMAQLFPAASAAASHPSSAHPSSAHNGPAKACTPAAKSGATPSCAIYTASMGAGWSVTGDGLKVLPGGTVPATREPAMLVERSVPATSHTAFGLTARSAVAIKPGDQVRLRVWGGEGSGTVLKLSVAPAGTGPVTLTAPAGRWTAYAMKLSQLTRGTSLTGLQLVVATDQVPDVNRFFLDDIALG
jgi:hypothetical protein